MVVWSYVNKEITFQTEEETGLFKQLHDKLFLVFIPYAILGLTADLREVFKYILSLIVNASGSKSLYLNVQQFEVLDMLQRTVSTKRSTYNLDELFYNQFKNFIKHQCLVFSMVLFILMKGLLQLQLSKYI